MNEVAAVCERFGADVEKSGWAWVPFRASDTLSECGMRLRRILLPEGRQGAEGIFRMEGHEMQILKAVEEVNERQKHVLFEKLERHFGSLKGKP